MSLVGAAPIDKVKKEEEEYFKFHVDYLQRDQHGKLRLECNIDKKEKYLTFQDNLVDLNPSKMTYFKKWFVNWSSYWELTHVAKGVKVVSVLIQSFDQLFFVYA